MKTIRIGFGMCGSFCTFQKAIAEMERLIQAGYAVLPIFSQMAYTADTRFGTAQSWIEYVETLCGRAVLHTIPEVEPIGPKRWIDLMVVCPCTGNTAAKLANGITDTPVTMAVKSSLRNQIPVLLTMATNDGLSGSAQNIGRLLNQKQFYFTPMRQDDWKQKPNSLVADFSRLQDSIAAALDGKQLQPLWITA